MRLDIGNDPTGLVSAFGLIAEAGAIALRLPGRPADRAFKQMTDALLQHRFSPRAGWRISDPGFEKLKGLRQGKGGATTETAPERPVAGKNHLSLSLLPG